jgi:hypothetical protein
MYNYHYFIIIVIIIISYLQINKPNIQQFKCQYSLFHIILSFYLLSIINKKQKEKMKKEIL